MKFPFPFKCTAETAGAVRLWPTCVNNPQTLSFRINNNHGDIYKITNNSVYLDDDDTKFIDKDDCADSVFSSCSIPFEDSESAVVGGLKSDRLIFEPGETNSILEEAKTIYSGRVVVAIMESEDPYSDFRSSMDEMVEAQGVKELENLEELLACYLRINCEINHRYIVEAFLDMLIHLGMGSAIKELFNSSSSSITTCSSPSRSSTNAREDEEDRGIEESSSSSSVISSHV